MTQTRTEVRELLSRHGVRPTKIRGQHFLVDPNIVRKIVRLVEGNLGDAVLEIGAGTGTLTRALADEGYRVLAYEIDERLRPVLEEVLADVPNAEVRFEDATRVPFAEVLDPSVGWTVAANLPYNVGTPLLMDLLRHVPQIDRFVVMVQREVADRLAAEPGSKAYGLPSVVARLHGSVRRAFDVPPQVFVPPPQVGSSVVVLQRLPVEDRALVERAIEIAAAGFGQRRKMLRRSLGSVLARPEEALEAAGISPEARAEDLAPEDLLRIATAERALEGGDGP